MSPLDWQGSQLTADERLSEARRLLDLITHEGTPDTFTDTERGFLEDMDTAEAVSPKQLAWLRRLRERLL
jgi:hypothetical protein